MRRIRQNSLHRGTVPLAAASLCLALALAAGPAQALPVTTYNTGAAGPGFVPTGVLANGTTDPNYVLVNPMGSGTVGGTPVGTAIVQSPAPSGWLPSGTNSEWLRPNPPIGIPPAFTYYFQTTFDLTLFDKTTAVMSGKWATFLQSPNINIFLNGTSLNSPSVGGVVAPSTVNAWAGFFGSGTSFSNALNPTINYLTFAVPSSPAVGITGLRVEYSIDAQPIPEPSTYALFALGLTGLGVARWRRLAAGSNASA